MDGNTGLNYTKIDNRVILGLNRGKKEKRALAIYIYLSYTGRYNKAIPVSLSILADILNVKTSTKNKQLLKSTLISLSDRGLVDFYSSKELDEKSDLDTITKDSKKTIWVRPYVCHSDINYTLIPINYIEDIIFSNTTESIEDLIVSLAYICAKTERRKSVSPIMWASINAIETDIHMDGKKFIRLSEELQRMEIVYFKLAELGSGRKNYIYGLYCDKEYVDSAVEIAQDNRALDRRVKSKLAQGDEDGVIERIEGNDYAVDSKLSSFFELHGIECNDGVMEETNKFYHKHGQKGLMNLLGKYNSEIMNADNKVGAYRGILKRNY